MESDWLADLLRKTIIDMLRWRYTEHDFGELLENRLWHHWTYG